MRSNEDETQTVKLDAVQFGIINGCLLMLHKSKIVSTVGSFIIIGVCGADLYKDYLQKNLWFQKKD